MTLAVDTIATYCARFGDNYKRSMFGGTGLFHSDAMFSLVTGGRFYLRGGADLDDRFMALDCPRYTHKKRSSTAVVNYYDVSELFLAESPNLDPLIEAAIEQAQVDRTERNNNQNLRLRDLPNLRLTLERMIKKSGVPDVDTFMDLGAAEVYKRVKQVHGDTVDEKLLWMFAGACEGIHWTLIDMQQQQALLRQTA
ncbi:DNA transformation protein TfoX1 [Vibrio stylophorae]|uniref:DNA transformation protein TfoX1 n=1 Tax=Vibrio stylophorae TaxID=659351 RepID=A0ABN8DTD0_9VIBR|nr:TfoX/Sxy family DNA transformation protein [Vibrio stylophorae]CAH0533524.1 DNA transformation protein TfoX1 [Vibrio stylophorae]